MDNLQEPAFPLINQEGTSIGDREVRYGFTKLEYAAILIAQGLLSNNKIQVSAKDIDATIPVRIAKAVLEEANK